MTRLVRMASVASALAFLLPLAGCSNFDPQDILENIMSSQKKPLEGERKPLFPTGTPGVRQGMPPDLVKGYQAPADQPDETAQAPTEGTKPKPKAKPKPKVAAKPPADAPAPANAAPQPAAAQASPWPNPPTARQSAAPGGVVWPDPPPVTR
jgi:hypothetical protein